MKLISTNKDKRLIHVDARALAAIKEEVAKRTLRTGVETGGLLVGPPGRRVVYEFLPSGQSAERQRARYTTDPSHLQSQLDAAWRRHGGDVVGYLHSHPLGLDHPSSQDLVEAARMLADPDYRGIKEEALLPIATVKPSATAGEEHAIDIRWFVFHRDGSLSEASMEPLPHWKAVEALEEELTAEGYQVERHVLAEEGMALKVIGAESTFIWVLPPAFPDEEPRLFELTAEDALVPVESADFAQLRGRGEEPKATAPSEAPQEPKLTPASPLDDVRVLATDLLVNELKDQQPVMARREGAVWVLGRGDQTVWLRLGPQGPEALLPGGRSVQVTVVPMTTDFDSRSAGIVQSGHLQAQATLIVGAGSVGSALADQLVRAGVGRIVLVDPDVVSVSNLCRSVYTLADVGRPKVEALSDRLLAIHPHLEIKGLVADICALDPDEHEAVLAGIDLAVVAVDRPEVIRAMDELLHARVPVVYPGVYNRGSGGEVLLTRPDAWLST